MITRRVINAMRYRRQGERRTRHRHAAVTASSQLCRSRERSATRSDFARPRLYPGRRSSPPGAGSQKWEPTCSAALRRSATHPECSRRSGAPRSTQSDGDRLRKPPWTSLTRKRSLVQIQYGPRGFSKSRPALRAKMGARLLRFCAISAGHGAGIPASTQGVPAVSVSSKPIAADAIECGNHAASRTSRTVNAARHAHTPTRRSRSVWVQHPCMASISAIPARSRSQPGRVRLACAYALRGGIQSLRRPRYVRAPRTSGPRGAQTGRARPRTAGGRSGPRPAASWRGVHRDPAPAVPADHDLPAFPGRPDADHEGEWRGGPACPRQAS